MKNYTKLDKEILLENLFLDCMEELRKKIYPYYKNKKVLKGKVILKLKDMEGTLGKIVSKEKDYKYTHTIYINKTVFQNYIECFHRNPFWYSWERDYCIKEAKNTMKHEILHGFTQELFEGFTDIDYIEHDASPFFLSIMSWAGVNSNHNCYSYFKAYSQWEKDINKFKKFKDLQEYLVHQLIKYQRISDNFKDVNNIEEYKKDPSLKLLSYKNKFYFNARSWKTKKPMMNVYKNVICSKDLEKSSSLTTTNIYNHIAFNCIQTPEQIEQEHLMKVIMSEKAELVTEQKEYTLIREDKTIKNIKIKVA